MQTVNMRPAGTVICEVLGCECVCRTCFCSAKFANGREHLFHIRNVILFCPLLLCRV